jgi:hypothetical protein
MTIRNWCLKVGIKSKLGAAKKAKIYRAQKEDPQQEKLKEYNKHRNRQKQNTFKSTVNRFYEQSMFEHSIQKTASDEI